MAWYKKILEENKREIICSAAISIALTLIFSLWYFINGGGFEWKTITPIEQPSLIFRWFYSAFVFSTVGAFLYYVVRLWKFLYFVCVKIFGNWKLYTSVKYIVWTSLILLAYFCIIPAIVKILNALISFFYNLAILFLYLFPPVGLLLLIFILSYIIHIVIKNQTNKTNPPIKN